MFTEIHKDIYTFNINLPNTALKQLNSYIIKGDDRNLILDTGFNLPESKADLLAGIHSLGLEVEDLELIITHLHSDHSGLAHIFAEAGCNIYASKIDGDIINAALEPQYWQNIIKFHHYYGFKSDEISITDNPGQKLQTEKKIDYIELKEGQIYQVGNYEFRILNLIGHTPGHIGLYDQTNDRLFGADTVLDPISSNITYWGPHYPNILAKYMETLQKLISLDLKQILPTHRKIIDHPNERMEELIEHHYHRLQEILDAMEYDREYTVVDLSASITWRVKFTSWQDFPRSQKWFAAGETMSHLDYLVHSGHVKMRESDEKFLFTKLKSNI